MAAESSSDSFRCAGRDAERVGEDAGPPIIGICGKIGAGKDTFGQMLKELADRTRGAGEPRVRRYEIVKFSTALRRVLEVFTGLSPQETSNAEGKARFVPEYDMTVGRMLQVLGTDAIREHFHPDAWVIATFNSPEARSSPERGIIITDLRFPNEAREIHKRGGVIYCVVRPEGESERPAETGRSADHVSEQAFLEIQPDVVVDNRGTLVNLEELALREWGALFERFPAGELDPARAEINRLLASELRDTVGSLPSSRQRETGTWILDEAERKGYPPRVVEDLINDLAKSQDPESPKSNDPTTKMHDHMRRWYAKLASPAGSGRAGDIGSVVARIAALARQKGVPAETLTKADVEELLKELSG